MGFYTHEMHVKISRVNKICCNMKRKKNGEPSNKQQSDGERKRPTVKRL